MDPALVERLRRLRGIERSFTDFRGRVRRVDDDSVLRLLAAFGHSVDDPEALAHEADVLEDLEWIRVLPPVVVLRGASRVPMSLIAPLPSRVRWQVEAEDGELYTGEAAPETLPVLQQRGVRGLWYIRLALDLPELPAGYHRLALEKTDGSQLAATCLVVAPRRCFEPEAVRAGGRLWGPAVQLYSLRSPRNWGIGDFTDLEGFVVASAGLGADAVGLNPLHALFPADPALCAPYSPSSRDYLNVLYIDPEAVPEFQRCTEARRLVGSPEFQARLAALREAPLVDYEGVAECKLEVLRLLHGAFLATASKTRRHEFDQFLNNGGKELELFGLFHAMHEHLAAAGTVGGWRDWPPGWQDPDGVAAKSFLAAEGAEVRFHCWLQWIAAGQLAGAAARARDAGMAVGLYLDLAVGASASGPETWMDRALYAESATIGAPPDALALQGQDWGIPPMRPDELRERAYEPFVRLLRANMRRAGALRIDHVMLLFRLWWVPAGRPSAEGSYVHYRLDEMMAIVALESRRNRCVVIGEDLGTVPPEIRRAMPEHGLYSYRVLCFEKDAAGAFRRPGDYPVEALVTVTTHDLPTLASYWAGSDIDLREQLGLYPEPEMAGEARAQREEDRRALLEALEAERLLPPGLDAAGTPPPEMDESLARAVHDYLARSRAALMVVQPEDWLLMTEPANVPGTHREYPNWTRKLVEDWPVLMARDSVHEAARELAAARRGEG
jgi:4-alpha-glucanotransferase